MDQDHKDFAESDELDRRRLTLVETITIVVGVLTMLFIVAALLFAVVMVAFIWSMRDFN